MGETEAKGASGCSRARFLTWFVVAQLLAQISAFAFLYSYVARLEYEMRTGTGCEECDAIEEPVPSRLNYPEDEPEPEISRQKRSGLLLEDNAVSEIFKIREEKEAQQQQRDVKKATASPVGPPIGGVEESPILPGSQDWVWLTADTRIPVDAIENFCRSSRDYCPPGPPGLPGVQGIPGPPGAPGSSGPSGDRGLPGLPGVSGPVGPPGLTGFPGARGPKGEMGSRGLDGRDGIPGEPGLDGVPGRSGVDGIAGRDGTPGLNGIPGRPGRNGTDGKQGPRGPPGPPGAQGPQGIAGPRGYKGKPGVNGTNGIPGVRAYSVRLANGTDSSELLIPPSILGNGSTYRVITVTESSNVRLRCAASGNPAPTIQWSRVGSAAVELGNWSMSSVTDRTLNITVVNRIHMGEYVCHADNGIPPRATQTFRLDVHFPPLIRIRNQMVGARLRGTAILECEIEAFPEAVTYWERGDGRLLENSEKYRINLIEKKDGYKAKMQLSITNITTADHSFYHCICKNEMGITRGVFTVYEITRRPPSGSVEQQQVVIYGERPPERKDLDDLCPAAPKCDTCPKCSLFYDAAVSRPDIKPINGDIRYSYFPPRTLDCLLYAVGKPVYHRFTDLTLHGCWMRDSSPRTDAAGEKLWVTKDTDPQYLYEYNNKTVFRKDLSRKIELPYKFKGNGHVVYNGCFFYNPEGRPTIIRFDVSSGNGERNATKELELPGLDYDSTNYLYTPKHNFNYVDFNVDDNGLWVIYACRSTNNTVVMKIDALLMLPQHSWNISMNHHKFGEMFIVCGVLYAVDSVTERTTKIRLALDLYKNISLEVNLSFSNPFRKTTMIGYNHKNKELFTWDKGNQLTYPIRYHEIGYNMTKEEAREMEPVAQMRTGVDVSNNKALEDSGY